MCLKRQFGKAVYGEVLEKILKETSARHWKKKKLKLRANPNLILNHMVKDKDLNYTLEIDELPSIKLQPLDNNKIY